MLFFLNNKYALAKVQYDINKCQFYEYRVIILIIHLFYLKNNFLPNFWSNYKTWLLWIIFILKQNISLENVDVDIMILK